MEVVTQSLWTRPKPASFQIQFVVEDPHGRDGETLLRDIKSALRDLYSGGTADGMMANEPNAYGFKAKSSGVLAVNTMGIQWLPWSYEVLVEAKDGRLRVTIDDLETRHKSDTYSPGQYMRTGRPGKRSRALWYASLARLRGQYADLVANSQAAADW